MNEIPLEENFDWWWYKAKANLLKNIIINLKINKQDLKILEIGPGLGNNLKILNNFGNVDILETEKKFIDYIKSNYFDYILNIYTSIDQLHQKYDLIIMADVLEHIEEPKKFLDKLIVYLQFDGAIIVGVPAYNFLWSNHDVILKHFRRYNWNMLQKHASSYNIVRKIGFNFLLLPVRVLQILIMNPSSTNNSSKVLNSIFFQISKIEHFIRRYIYNPKFGLSIYAILKSKVN